MYVLKAIWRFVGLGRDSDPWRSHLSKVPIPKPAPLDFFVARNLLTGWQSFVTLASTNVLEFSMNTFLQDTLIAYFWKT